MKFTFANYMADKDTLQEKKNYDLGPPPEGRKDENHSAFSPKVLEILVPDNNKQCKSLESFTCQLFLFNLTHEKLY